ncbi:MAG TPA: hypothetical protein VFS46_08380 [Nitrososphaera sp.]|nr:hypothetical protein [Nitrososphaera sp.]
MGFGGLALFMAGMWAMILAVAAFLLIVVAPLETILPVGRLAVSAAQAAIAIAAVAALVLGLSRMKRIYMHRKLG